MDTLGLLLAVVVHAANVQDRDGAKLVLAKARARCPRLQLLWADGNYAGQLIDWVRDTCGWLLEIIKRPAEAKGFQLLPRRWVVERTFAWMANFRRLNRDYERLAATLRALHVSAHAVTLLARAMRDQRRGTRPMP